MIMNNDIEVLIIDDDHDVLESYQQLLEMSGFKVKAITDPTLATSLLHKNWARCGRHRYVYAGAQRHGPVGVHQKP